MTIGTNRFARRGLQAMLPRRGSVKESREILVQQDDEADSLLHLMDSPPHGLSVTGRKFIEAELAPNIYTGGRVALYDGQELEALVRLAGRVLQRGDAHPNLVTKDTDPYEQLRFGEQFGWRRSIRLADCLRGLIKLRVPQGTTMGLSLNGRQLDCDIETPEPTKDDYFGTLTVHPGALIADEFSVRFAISKRAKERRPRAQLDFRYGRTYASPSLWLTPPQRRTLFSLLREELTELTPTRSS